ncbi:hypothetical protein GF318_03745 [Candidatus Micrarchaeota archaeon]|nr:hypothetical protein [Candidatus Micrarchaeota archaeon]
MVPGVREAAAEERQRDVRPLQAIRDTLVEQLGAVRSRMQEMERQGFPASVDWSDPTMGPLLQTLRQLDQQLRPFNDGQEVIPLSGSSDEQRFRSLNRWLGRDQGSPLGEDALRQLEMRVTLAFGLVSSDAAASQLSAVLAGRTPEEQPAPAEAEAEEAAPVFDESRRAYYTGLMNQLDVIAGHARRRQDRRAAARLRDRLREQLENDSPDSSALETIDQGRERRGRRVGGASRLIARGYEEAQQRADRARVREETRAHEEAVARANQEREEARAGGEELAASETRPLLEGLQGMREQHRDLVNNLINLLNNSYRLGEGQRERLIRAPGEEGEAGLLWQARDALQQGNDRRASELYAQANQLYTSQQTLYRAMLSEFVVPVAREAAGTASDVPGIEPLQSRMRERAEAAQGHLDEGDMSFFYTWNLYLATWSEYQAMSVLEDLWQEADRLVPEGHGSRGRLEENLGSVLQAISTRGYNPLQRYEDSDPIVVGLLRDFRSATGNPSATREELEQAIRSNPDWSIQLALYDLYRRTTHAAYEPSGGLSTEREQNPARYHLARMRTARALFRDDYQHYYYAEWTNVDNRFTDGRAFLDQTVQLARESGMEQNDPLIEYCEQRLQMHPDAGGMSDEQKSQTGDMFYEMAMGLAAIREAELWISDANSQLRGAHVDDATMDRARALLQRARLEFEENFSVMTPGTDSNRVSSEERSVAWDFTGLPGEISESYAVPPMLHMNFPREIADDVIHLVAPQAYHELETYSTNDTGNLILEGRVDYLVARSEAENQVGEQVTDEIERMVQLREIDERLEVRSTVVSTRDDGLERGTVSEYMFLRTITALRDQGNFGAPTLADRQRAWARAMEVLSPEIGRATVLGSDRQGIRQVRTTPSYPRLTVGVADFVHQDARAAYPQGELYTEMRRQVFLHTDDNVTPLLRHLGVDPARGQGMTDMDPSMTGVRGFLRSMDQVASGYSAGNPQTSLQSGNEVLVGVATERLEELNRRLSERREVDGVSISELSRSTDPRSYIVRRAVAVRDREARRIAEYRTSLGQDLVEPGTNPRLSILALENAIHSLSHDVGPIREPPEQVRFFSQGTDLEEDIVNSIRVARARIDVQADPTEGLAVSLEQYERANGRQTLLYNWVWWVDLGRDDWFLLNPNWDTYLGSGPCNGWVLDPESGMPVNPETRLPSSPRTGESVPGAEPVELPQQFIARLMEMPEGSGRYAAVRVRPPGRETGAEATMTVEWEPVRLSNGRLDILFRELPGEGGTHTLQPLRADMTADVVRDTCTRTVRPESVRPVSGDAAARAIVRPR